MKNILWILKKDIFLEEYQNSIRNLSIKLNFALMFWNINNYAMVIIIFSVSFLSLYFFIFLNTVSE